jgi:mevalonate kinase
MLMGEHAVLRGQPALVCAISRRIKVRLNPLADKTIRLHSALGEFETTLDELAPNESFRFVRAAIRHRREKLEQGFEMEIRSDMSHQMGLGSSAAVVVATLAALDAACGGKLVREDLLADGVQITRRVQGGVGSGADVAGSTYGGCLRYFGSSREVVKLSTMPELTVLYSGSKMPTPDVIAFVEEKRKQNTELYDELDALIGKTVRQAFEAAANGDWEWLGALMNVNQGLMDALGVNNGDLSSLVYDLRKDPRVFGSKISGSGLGDCVVALGKAMRSEWGVPSLEVRVEPEGVQIQELPS